MNIDEIIERECPRYVKTVIMRFDERVQAIIDSHSGASHPVPVKTFRLGDESIDEELDKLNSDYEQHLRNHLRRYNEF